MPYTLLGSFSAQFTWIDWSVVAGYFIFTTWLATALAGKQSTMRDFFLGGRKLPWYAVSGSIIATETSALTFVIVPFIVFNTGPEGNLKYLQLGLFGSIFARIIVGYLLVPAYYEREIYSPYDYMGNRLGNGVRSMTTVLFAVGGMLSQSARVYLTAEVLLVVLNDQLTWLSDHVGLFPLGWAIVLIAIVAIVWTLIGGIATVIWTDVLLFLLFLAGAVIALFTVAANLDGGFREMIDVGWNARETTPIVGEWGKFTFFDFSHSPTRAFTIWTAVIASTWGGIGPYGTDQLIVQRLFCCKGPKEARWAIIGSAAGQFVTATVALVGIGLFAYYRVHPLTGDALELFKENGNRIFLIFIVEVIPVGLKGLIIAAIFAAAVSSLTSILAALSQTVMSAFYQPMREKILASRGIAHDPESDHEDRHGLRVGRFMVFGWGVVLSLMAYVAWLVSKEYRSILDLGLALAGYTHGALLAGFLLAFLPLKVNGRGLLFSGPLSVLCVFSIFWHEWWAHYVCWGAGALLLGLWFISVRSNTPGFASKTVVLVAGIALMLVLSYYGYWEGPFDDNGDPTKLRLAWPWYTPLGSVVAFTWGYLLAGPRRDAEPVAVAAAPAA